MCVQHNSGNKVFDLSAPKNSPQHQKYSAGKENVGECSSNKAFSADYRTDDWVVEIMRDKSHKRSYVDCDAQCFITSNDFYKLFPHLILL